MFLFFKKKYLITVFFLLPILISCSSIKKKNSFKNLSANQPENKSIDLNNLKVNLYNADKKLTPKLIRKNDGSTFYTYIKKPGEGEISLEEIKERILLGPDFYKNDRENVIRLLMRINELKINNKLEYIDNRDDLVLIGETDAYEARCRAHWDPHNFDHEQQTLLLGQNLAETVQA